MEKQENLNNVISGSDKITYFEKRTINIGDFENVECGLYYGSDIKKITPIDNTIEIFEQNSITITEDKEAFNLNIKRLVGRTKSVLDKREYEVRKFYKDSVDEKIRAKLRIIREFFKGLDK